MSNTPSLQERIESNYIQGKLAEYVRLKSYVKDALKQRKIYNQDPDAYDPFKAPENVRDLCIIAQESMKKAVTAEFAANVEHLPQNLAMDICQKLDKRDTPAVPYVESLVRKYNLDPEAPAQDAPTP